MQCPVALRGLGVEHIGTWILCALHGCALGEETTACGALAWDAMGCRGRRLSSAGRLSLKGALTRVKGVAVAVFVVSSLAGLVKTGKGRAQGKTGQRRQLKGILETWPQARNHLVHCEPMGSLANEVLGEVGWAGNEDHEAPHRVPTRPRGACPAIQPDTGTAH